MAGKRDILKTKIDKQIHLSMQNLDYNFSKWAQKITNYLGIRNLDLK